MNIPASAGGVLPKEPWLRDGQFVYALYDTSEFDRDGKPIQVNRFSLYVEGRAGFNSTTGERYGCSDEEAEAVARLIVAAPDLLEALRAVMAEYRAGYGLRCVDQIRTAIAKAEGGAT